ncbi:MAG: sugar phosphate nucleotidyltransferase, partial [Promethearchaeota archaeon]
MGNELLQQKNKFKEIISAVILCAGEGTRLKKITKTTPKPLIKIEKFKNIPILLHTINNLVNLEIEQIGIVIGYLGKKISNFISNLIKENDVLQEKLQIINAKKQYKFGPLYSFLSITKNKNFFTKDHYYLVIPGDTVFETNILVEVLNLISNNYALIEKFPFLFYRNIEISKLIELYSIDRFISNAEIEILDSNFILKKISILKVDEIPHRDTINQIIPIIGLNYNAVIEI